MHNKSPTFGFRVKKTKIFYRSESRDNRAKSLAHEMSTMPLMDNIESTLSSNLRGDMRSPLPLRGWSKRVFSMLSDSGEGSARASSSYRTS